jgi:uncharacterized membrane protein YgdD (TMEM256/DUF423 family)
MDRFFFSAGAIAHSWPPFSALSVPLPSHHTHGRDARHFEVGVRYQMYHAFGLVAVAWAITRWPQAKLNAAGWCFIAGIIIFSGSLYLLSFTGIREIGVITPVGGLAFLAGWAILLWSVNR